jgi:pimeloyl-ACP methyl ester carboxylesterase
MALTYENTSKFAQAKGVKIHYHEAGAGPVLIMVPGTGAGATAWVLNKYNIEGLSKHFRVILYNPPPVGESDKTITFNGPLNPFYAGILLDFMDTLGIDKAHLYGGSPGSGQVIRLALDHPERVGKLVLQCVTGLGRSLFTAFPWEGSRLTGVTGRDPSLENVTAQMEAMVPRADRRRDLIMDRYNAANDKETNEARRRITGTRGEDISPELPRISQPTLIIWGVAEKDVPLDFGLRLAANIPNARLHIYGDGTGHFPNVEQAEDFNRLLTEVLLH